MNYFCTIFVLLKSIAKHFVLYEDMHKKLVFVSFPMLIDIVFYETMSVRIGDYVYKLLGCYRIFTYSCCKYNVLTFITVKETAANGIHSFTLRNTSCTFLLCLSISGTFVLISIVSCTTIYYTQSNTRENY